MFFSMRDFGFACALVIFILAAGTWQVEVSKIEQAKFGHEAHGAHMPVTREASMD
jgi:hypothetical protein